MTDAEYSQKLDELDQLLNDPDVPMQPDRIWSLLADVAQPELVPARRGLAKDPSSGAGHQALSLALPECSAVARDAVASLVSEPR